MVVIGLTRHLSDNKLTCVVNECKAGTDLCEVYRGLPVIMGWFHLLITLRVARERFWQREACEQLREERWTGPKDSWISLVISWVDLADKTVFVLLADGKRIQYPQIISVNMTHLQQNDYKPITDKHDYFQSLISSLNSDLIKLRFERHWDENNDKHYKTEIFIIL